VGVAGGLMCNFLVYYSDKEKKRTSDDIIHSTFARIGRSDTSPDLFSIYGISCENYAEADKVIAKLKSIDGVSNARMRIIKEFIIVEDWLRTQIARRLRESEN
jgi:hypothetical protein